MLKLALRVRALAILALLAGLICAAASAKDMVNIIKNPGFEDGMPEPWYITHRGDYKVIHDAAGAKSGEYYASFAWRLPPPQCYSALCTPRLTVYPGVTYTFSVWAKGSGSIKLWVIQTSKSGISQGADFSKTFRISGKWQRISRKWTAPAGIHGANLFILLDGGVNSYDDVSFAYDRDKFTPPEAETLEVTPQVKATDATFKLTLNGKPLDGPVKILYGEQVIGIEAQATGAKPRLAGAIRFGEHVVKLDKRWRSDALPAESSWQEPGYDDRKWQPVAADNGVWGKDGMKNLALRRVVLWKLVRKEPWRENQWLSMMRDHMYVAEGSAGSFVHIVPEREKIHARELILHLEVPAYLTLLDRYEQASTFHSNYAYEKVDTSTLQKDGVDYTHFKFVYHVPRKLPWTPYAPMYFKADEQIAKEKKYTFTFWREWNGNVTDVPMVMPITVTGPVNGRQCKYFHLSYNRPVLMHSGAFGTFSMEERQAMADTCIAAGMNVVWASMEKERGVLDYFLDLKKRGVLLSYGSNLGMNWPHQADDRESAQARTMAAHPELQIKFYDGTKEAFTSGLGFNFRSMDGKVMWCQEYLATGGKVFYDLMRPRFSKAKATFGDLLYTMWDWEYDTFGWSCFCNRCKTAFGKFAKVKDAVNLSAQTIVTKYPKKWIKFRIDQNARHQMSMMKFLEEYDMLLTNWRPGGGIKCNDFDYSLLGDTYDYHFMGWPGSGLPYRGAGRASDFISNWKKMNPDVHLVAQTIVDNFPGDVIDERMFKIWTINIALGTHGGGWLLWLDSLYPLPQSHGMSYFLGEATRLIDTYEEFFKKRKHISVRFRQQGLTDKMSELIALEGPAGRIVLKNGETMQGKVRGSAGDNTFVQLDAGGSKLVPSDQIAQVVPPGALVLLFNQDDKPAEVTVTVKNAAATKWKTVQQWEGKKFDNVATLTVTVPAKDVIALHYR